MKKECVQCEGEHVGSQRSMHTVFVNLDVRFSSFQGFTLPVVDAIAAVHENFATLVYILVFLRID